MLLSIVPLAIGFVIATSLALFAHRYRVAQPFFLAFVGALFTIPSIAFYLILLNITGRGFGTAVVVLTAYTQVLIYRNVMTGLQEVPAETVDVAEGMGLTQRQILFRVELPMALPTIFAGLRIAASSTVGIAGFAFFAGAGGLGGEIFSRPGLQGQRGHGVAADDPARHGPGAARAGGAAGVHPVGAGGGVMSTMFAALGPFGDAIDFIFQQRESQAGTVRVGGLAEIWELTWMHLKLSLAATAIATLVALPIGVWLGHIGRYQFLAISARRTSAAPCPRSG